MFIISAFKILLGKFCLLSLKGDFTRRGRLQWVQVIRATLFLNVFKAKYANPKTRQSFTKVPQIYGNWVDCLKYLAKLQPFDNNIRAVAQPTLSYMKRISLVSYTYDFRLWPGMVIWIYAARMGKRAGMPLNWILLVFTISFLEVLYHQRWEKTEQATLPDQKTQRFFDVWFPTATQAYSSWNSSKAKFEHFSARTNWCNCNKRVCDSWG